MSLLNLRRTPTTLKKCWGIAHTKKDCSLRWEGYSKDWDTEEPVETFLPSYNKVWRDYLQTHNLTQTIDLLAHLGGALSLMSRINKKIYCV